MVIALKNLLLQNQEVYSIGDLKSTKFVQTRVVGKVSFAPFYIFNGEIFEKNHFLSIY